MSAPGYSRQRVNQCKDDRAPVRSDAGEQAGAGRLGTGKSVDYAPLFKM